MPRKSKSFGDELNGCKLCLEGHKRNQGDFPFLKNELAGFEKLITSIEKENVKQEQLKAGLLSQTKVVNGIMADLNKGYAALVRYAKAKYGPNSPKLQEFVSKTEGKTRKKAAAK